MTDMTDHALAGASTESASARSATGSDQRYQYADDSSRVSDFDKDTGTDERMEVTGADRSDAWFQNGKRTYDLHQTLDADALIDKKKHQSKLDSMEMAEREQRMRHTEAEFNQRMRHADRMDAISNSTIAALLGDMAEKLGVVMDAVVKK